MRNFLVIVLIFFSTKSLSQNKSKEISSDVKLVVGLVVDQMKYEYIPKFWNKYGEKGFKRLINNGFTAKMPTIVMLLHQQDQGMLQSSLVHHQIIMA